MGMRVLENKHYKYLLGIMEDIVFNNKIHKLSRIALAGILGLTIMRIFNVILRIIENPYKFQWDFHTYYYSGMALKLGYNPYDYYVVRLMADPAMKIYPFVYTPFAFPFIKLLTFGDVLTNYYIFLLIKIIAFTVLTYIWYTVLLSKKGSFALFLSFIIFSFNGACVIDIKAGNITILLELILWCGLIFLIRGQLFLFSLFIIIASSFKLFYLPFLLLGLFVKNRIKSLIYTSFLSLIAIFIFFYFYSDYIYKYLSGLSFLPMELGLISPGIMSFWSDLFKLLEFQNYSVYSQITYCITVLAIFAVTVKRLYTIKSEIPFVELVLLFCSLLILCLPRLKDYYLISLIVPSYYMMLKKIRNPVHFIIVFAFYLLPTYRFTHWSLSSYNIGHFMLNYIDLAQAMVTWILCLPTMKQAEKVAFETEPAGSIGKPLPEIE